MSDASNGDRPATKQDIERAIELLLNEMGRRFEEVDRRFEAMDRRFEGLDRRIDRLGETAFFIQNQMAAMTKWADRLDRDNNNMTATQAAQQRAIDELAARVSKLEGQRQ